MSAGKSIEAPSSRRPPTSRAYLTGLGALFRYGWRQARRLFHVLVGLTFLVFAGIGASLAYSEWQAYAHNPANGVWRFATIAGFSLLLVIFGLYSFLKARSVQ